MDYFFRVLKAHMVHMFRSAAFWVTTLCFLLLVLVMGIALPQGSQQMSLEVGVLPEGEWGEQVEELLLSEEDFRYRRYHERSTLERDILTGALHCGYLLEEGKVTALVTSASYLRPLIDELIFTAAMEVDAPGIAQKFLQDSLQPADGIPETFRNLSQTEPSMEIEVIERGGAPLERFSQGGLQPLLYAVLVTAFLAASALTELLSPVQHQRALCQLAVLGERRIGTLLGIAGGNLLLNGGILLVAGGLTDLLLQTSIYPWKARWILLGSLAGFSVLLSLGITFFRRFYSVLIALLPLWCFCSVLFSGALIDPARLPYGLGTLRFLSPSWYGLQILQQFL